MGREAENSAPAIVTAHPFVPRFEWFTTCRVCGLAEAAHAESVLCPLCGEQRDDLTEELCQPCAWSERPQ